MTTSHYPAFGVSKEYDEQVERESERKRAFYKSVAKKHQLELAQQEAERNYAEALRKLQQLEPAYKAAKAEASAAKKQLNSVQSSSRRKDNDENKALREQAALAGEKTYMPVTACRNGHYARRYVSSGVCAECDRIGWKDGKLRPEVILTAST